MLKRILALLLFPACAQANTFATDATDLWYNQNESGWGVNVIHQSDTLFATLFVYSSAGSAAWYVGSSVVFTGQQGSAFVYSGPLYQTNGPWFGAAFNPSAVGVRQVGTITFTFTTITQGTVTYSVDGVAVTKSIVRQTWKNNNLGGSYLGASIGTYSGCASGNGPDEEPAVFTVTHSGSSMTVAAAFSGYSCTYSGLYQQNGRMGAMSASLACSDGTRGTLSAFEVEASISGFTGRGIAQFGGSCMWTGRFGGLRR